MGPEAGLGLLEGVGAVPLLGPVCHSSAWSHAGERLNDARLGLLVPAPGTVRKAEQDKGQGEREEK